LNALFSTNTMKRLLPFCSLVILCGAVMMAGCQQDPSSTSTSSMQLPLSNPHGGGGSTPANPVLTWTGYLTSHGTTYGAVYVADSDMTHVTAVHLSPSGNTWFKPTSSWSPSGSICFSKGGGTVTAPDTIEAVDVSVNSSGVAVGSNFRVIVGMTSQADRLNNPFWSSTTAMNKIAYTTYGAAGKLWVVSASGGTPTLILSVDTGDTHNAQPLVSPTWNADDSKLAVLRRGATTSTILIYNTSTWVCVDSIPCSGMFNGLEWSRTGMDKIATTLNGQLYFVDPTTNATPTTSGVVGSLSTWSPNNSSVLYQNSGNLYKNVPFTSTITLVASGSAVKWRR